MIFLEAPDVGADDDAEAVAECLHAALSVAEVVVEHARDEVAVLELDLPPPLELAVAVLAPLEPGIRHHKQIIIQSS